MKELLCMYVCMYKRIYVSIFMYVFMLYLLNVYVCVYLYLYMSLHMHITDKLDGASLNGSAESNEWGQLTSELSKAKRFIEESESLLNSYNSVKSQTSELLNAFDDSGEPFNNCVRIWNNASATFESSFKKLFEQESNIKLYCRDISTNLKDEYLIVQLISEALKLLTSITDAINNDTVNTSINSSNQYIIDMKDLTVIAHRLIAAIEDDSDFVLLQELSVQINHYHNSLSLWVEELQNLNLHKITRIKSKQDHGSYSNIYF